MDDNLIHKVKLIHYEVTDYRGLTKVQGRLINQFCPA